MTKLNDASAIYLGSQAADAVYLGTTKVWAPPAQLLSYQSTTLNNGNANNGDGTYGSPVTFTLDVNEGDTLTVVTSFSGAAAGTRKCTDTAGNAYTEIADGGGGKTYAVWQARAGTTGTITISANIAAYYAYISAAVARTRGGATQTPITGSGTGYTLTLSGINASGPAIVLVAADAHAGSLSAGSGTVAWTRDQANVITCVGHGTTAGAVSNGTVVVSVSNGGAASACVVVVS